MDHRGVTEPGLRLPVANQSVHSHKVEPSIRHRAINVHRIANGEASRVFDMKAA